MWLSELIYDINGNLDAGALGIGADQSPDLLGNTTLTADDLTHILRGNAQLQRQFLIAFHLSDGDGIRVLYKVSGDVEQQVFHAVPSNRCH